jgi:ketosteroid isomerase-like protein
MSDASHNPTVAIVDRFIRAIEDGDGAALQAIYADDATIWQNFAMADQSRDENIALLLRVAGVGSLKYLRSEIEAVGERVFLRHTLRIVFEEGRVLEIPAAMFITTRDGRITRIFEYVDSAQFMVPGLIEALTP